MDIVTSSAPNFPIPSACIFCGGKIHKHGKRGRHVIEQGWKIWDFVQRFLCIGCCGTFTILQPNMLPHKHYAASEIEQVLHSQENPTAPLHECGAEESTIRRWMQEFPEKLSALAACLESLANMSRIQLLPPLQRINNVFASLVSPPPNWCRLAWAFFVIQSHPVRI
jgi:transposase-like protein